jgi:predicted RND superfamily exporter protein
MDGFIGLAFSDHRGLATLGITGMLGLGMSILAPLLVMPAILGFLAVRRQASEFPSSPRPLYRLLEKSPRG